MKNIGDTVKTIIDSFMRKKEKAKVPESNLKNTQESVVSEKKTIVVKPRIENTETISETKESEATSISFKEKIILESMNRVGTPCTHNQVLKDIKSRNMNEYFDLRTNWKETWKVMKDLTKKDVLMKEDKYYSLKE